MLNTPSHHFEAPQPGFIKSMLDASMHGILLLEPVRNFQGQVKDFLVLAANSAIEQQVNFRPDLAINQLMSDVFQRYRETGFFDCYVAALQTREVQRKELFYSDHRTEGWFDLGVAPHGDLLVVTFVNITDTRNYRQAIQRYASQLHTIIDVSQSGMFLFSPVKDGQGDIIDFIFTMANRALAGYVGQEPNKLVGEPGSKWFPGYKTNGLFDLYKETYVTGRTNRFDFNYNTDGIDVWLDIMATRFEDELLVTFTDYTHVKKMQLELETNITLLKHSNAYLEEFAYAASHDLQEPLRKIQFYSDQLKKQVSSGDTKDSPAMLERLDSAANRMKTLIEDLLSYARVSAEQNAFKLVNLNMVLQEVMNDLETPIREKEAMIQIAQLPVIQGNNSQIHQMFQNLLSNALKYNQPGKKPRITVECSRENGRQFAEIVKAQDVSRIFYLIRVKDEGLGFEQQYSEKIFQIFQRLHGRSEYPGTGVGLAIARKVAENHHGYIWAEGHPGEGALFNILLPAGS